MEARSQVITLPATIAKLKAVSKPAAGPEAISCRSLRRSERWKASRSLRRTGRCACIGFRTRSLDARVCQYREHARAVTAIYKYRPPFPQLEPPVTSTAGLDVSTFRLRATRSAISRVQRVPSVHRENRVASSLDFTERRDRRAPAARQRLLGRVRRHSFRRHHPATFGPAHRSTVRRSAVAETRSVFLRRRCDRRSRTRTECVRLSVSSPGKSAAKWPT